MVERRHLMPFLARAESWAFRLLSKRRPKFAKLNYRETAVTFNCMRAKGPFLAPRGQRNLVLHWRRFGRTGDRPTRQPANWPISQPANLPTDQLSNLPANRRANRPTGQPSHVIATSSSSSLHRHRYIISTWAAVESAVFREWRSIIDRR